MGLNASTSSYALTHVVLAEAYNFEIYKKIDVKVLLERECFFPVDDSEDSWGSKTMQDMLVNAQTLYFISKKS